VTLCELELEAAGEYYTMHRQELCGVRCMMWPIYFSCW